MHIISKENVLTYIDYNPLYSGLNVTEFGLETNSPPEHGSKLQLRHNFIIHFVLDGKGYFMNNRRRYNLKKGKAFVITPKNPVLYEADPGTNWTYCWIAFSGTDCDTLFNQCGLDAKNTVFDFDDEVVKPLLDQLEYIRNQTPTNPTTFGFSVSSMCYQVLINIATALHTQPQAQTKKTVTIIDAAITYMQNNLHSAINVSTLCKELGISRTYFSTIFKNTLKQSPYQYLQNMRIQKASELLLTDHSLRIYEISEIVGFSSIVQFCKAFRSKTGCSPTKYRNTFTHKT